MKKINIKILSCFTFVLGIIIGFVVIYASVALQSSDVLYDNSNSKLNSTTLQNAIDELAIKAETVREECPKGYTCESVIKAVSGTGENIGDEVCIGDECFYVISNNGTTMELLAKYNLYVGNICTAYSNSSCTAISSNEVTNKQDSRAIGYDDSKGGFPATGTTAFGTSSTYTTSTVKTYVDNYVKYLKDTYDVEVTGTLITEAQVRSLGSLASGNGYLSSTYPWLYSTSYWTQSAYSSSRVWDVASRGSFGGDSYSYAYYYGVRPVITVSSL